MFDPAPPGCRPHALVENERLLCPRVCEGARQLLPFAAPTAGQRGHDVVGRAPCTTYRAFVFVCCRCCCLLFLLLCQTIAASGPAMVWHVQCRHSISDRASTTLLCTARAPGTLVLGAAALASVPVLGCRMHLITHTHICVHTNCVFWPDSYPSHSIWSATPQLHTFSCLGCYPIPLNRYPSRRSGFDVDRDTARGITSLARSIAYRSRPIAIMLSKPQSLDGRRAFRPREHFILCTDYLPLSYTLSLARELQYHSMSIRVLSPRRARHIL